MKWRQGGFTITETLLFLAGSSALIGIAITAVGQRNREVQFTDSMRTIHSYLQQRREFVRNGVTAENDPSCSWSSGGYNFSVAQSDGSCLLVGYEVNFSEAAPNNTKIILKRIYGHRLSIDAERDCRSAGTALSACFDFEVSPTEVSSFTMPWGTKYVASNREPESVKFAFIRNPLNGSLETWTDAVGGVSATGIEYCFVSPDGRNGKIILGKQGSPEAIDLEIGGADSDACPEP